MNYSFIDFNRISKALSTTLEALKNDDQQNCTILLEAENNFRQALSIGLSNSK